MEMEVRMKMKMEMLVGENTAPPTSTIASVVLPGTDICAAILQFVHEDLCVPELSDVGSLVAVYKIITQFNNCTAGQATAPGTLSSSMTSRAHGIRSGHEPESASSPALAYARVRSFNYGWWAAGVSCSASTMPAVLIADVDYELVTLAECSDPPTVLGGAVGDESLWAAIGTTGARSLEFDESGPGYSWALSNPGGD